MANIQILILIASAVVALLFAVRLYSVLGRRTGNEREPTGAFDRISQVAKAKAQALAPPRPAIAPAQPGNALFEIQLADKSFDVSKFLSGARQAYEIVVTAYAANDRDALRPLLSQEVFGAFEGAMAARAQRGETVAFKFMGFRDVHIVHSVLKDRRAEITVEFNAQFVSATRDAAGKVVEGDPEKPRDVIDDWTFARDTAASDPNWTLVATAGPEAL